MWKQIILAVLVAAISSTGSQALALSSRVQKAVAQCDTTYEGEAGRLQRILCNLDVRLGGLESQAKGTGDSAAIRRELDQARKRRAELAEAVKLLAQAAKKDEVKQRRPAKKKQGGSAGDAEPQKKKRKKKRPRPAPQALAQGPPTFQVVERPGQYAALTFEPVGVSNRLRIHDLTSGVRKWLKGGVPAGQARLVLIKNGQPVAITHPGGQFNTFYADMDGDGKPEGRPYAGVNPGMVQDLYIPWRQGDQAQLVYLTDTGLEVEIQGRGTYPIWGNGVRVRTPSPSNPGKRVTHGTNGARIY